MSVKTMSVKSTITEQFKQVAREQDRTLAPLSEELQLVQSGLDSLSFAIIVARLEDSLGVDPFNATEAVEFPVTFGDFVRLYERFAK
jgi:acyl carrier protein